MLNCYTAASSLGAVLGLGRRRGRTLCRPRLVGGANRRSRSARPQHLRERRARALRRVSRTWSDADASCAARLQPRRQEGQAADRLACCARPTVARWRSRCSRATPPIRARSPHRSTRSEALRDRARVLVGDRGMITQARIDAEIAPAGLDWITALRAPAIRALAEAGALQMSRSRRDMAAITSPDYRANSRRLPQSRSRAADPSCTKAINLWRSSSPRNGLESWSSESVENQTARNFPRLFISRGKQMCLNAPSTKRFLSSS